MAQLAALIVVAGIAAASSDDPFKAENEKIAAYIEETKALEAKLTADSAEADKHLEQLRRDIGKF